MDVRDNVRSFTFGDEEISTLTETIDLMDVALRKMLKRLKSLLEEQGLQSISQKKIPPDSW